MYFHVYNKLIQMDSILNNSYYRKIYNGAFYFFYFSIRSSLAQSWHETYSILAQRRFIPIKPKNHSRGTSHSTPIRLHRRKTPSDSNIFPRGRIFAFEQLSRNLPMYHCSFACELREKEIKFANRRRTTLMNNKGNNCVMYVLSTLYC